MLLNYQWHQPENDQQRTPLVLIHGLFGSLSNLGGIARALYATYAVLQIDVRNHGQSPHSSEMNYQVMAQDILETLDHLNIQQFSVIGHSMGGKVAMKLTELAAERLEQLVILDIAPFAYQENHHDQIFKALFAVKNAAIQSRKEATEIMREFLKEEMVIQFLLKSFNKGQWLFNVDALYAHYQDILSWVDIPQWSKPTLFVRGENSPYIGKALYVNAIEAQFSHAQLETVANAGHWLHAEQPEKVLNFIQAYLN
ncbi:MULTISPECIES: alpha/beta fold hydrolase [unclassified Acinetobacter]|uniref:alpha/beta fold hydrolase n=1 Tax=unclassified Acinetobacter TaxID=196816 RepID=UPI00257535B7|nr:MULTISPECIES: alpha/beta fold hydrolase [unclassified Acinetobacter]MDM1764365.1 alpha/beta fold hydrolase [Acinetobacter sp. 226-1]MDM1767339.1 alpha/beta fold hydrolase [Acinetobacter sp. 226-4]